MCWATLLKSRVWILEPDTRRPNYELYNLARPGEQVKFVRKNYKTQLKMFGRDGWGKMAIIGCGANDARKRISPQDNLSFFANTPSGFIKSYKRLLDALSSEFDKVCVLGFTWVDESKTAFKINPLDEKLASSFMNDRLQLFSNALKELCKNYQNVEFIDAPKFDISCLCQDGLHPNDKGHGLIFETIKWAAEDFLLNKD